MLPEYDFSDGVRGKYAAYTGASSVRRAVPPVAILRIPGPPPLPALTKAEIQALSRRMKRCIPRTKAVPQGAATGLDGSSWLLWLSIGTAGSFPSTRISTASPIWLSSILRLFAANLLWLQAPSSVLS